MLLQDQVNDVTDYRDLPHREPPLEKLLLGQYGLIVEDISQYLNTNHTLTFDHTTYNNCEREVKIPCIVVGC